MTYHSSVHFYFPQNKHLDLGILDKHVAKVEQSTTEVTISSQQSIWMAPY